MTLISLLIVGVTYIGPVRGAVGTFISLISKGFGTPVEIIISAPY